MLGFNAAPELRVSSIWPCVIKLVTRGVAPDSRPSARMAWRKRKEEERLDEMR